MELRELRYFAAAVQAGSLSAGAAELRISQPSLSVAVNRLETELGVGLLTRSPRGVVPTSAGRYLLDASSRVLGDVDEIVRQLRDHGAGLAGTLTLAAVPVLMWKAVPRLLRAHAAEAPDVGVRLIDPPPWTAIDMLQDRRADLAAIVVAESSRFLRADHGGFQVVDWGPVPLVAALPREALPPSHEGPVPLSYFTGRRIVLPHRTTAVPSLPEVVEEALHRHGVTPSAVLRAETIQASIPLIEAGIAAAILPDPGRCSLTRFDIDVRPLTPEPPPLRAIVLGGEGASSDATVRRLLDHVTKDHLDHL